MLDLEQVSTWFQTYCWREEHRLINDEFNRVRWERRLSITASIRAPQRKQSNLFTKAVSQECVH